MASENAPSSSSRSSNGPWQPPALEEIQALFPQYEIVALLGRGGMGAVYKGWQRSLDRFVAIKILPQGLTDDPQYSERFKQEAKSMAKLAHAGIVAVFDAGELANGMLYFVMEFIEGTDVQKMIAEQGSLPPAHAMAITAHVCDALQYAHDRGIIHRDIKPANIMVGYDGVVKVADFGLAKQQQEGVSGLTQSGMVMGTLHYMAPESLILGVSVDHRADIYAVGIMLYQMLTGRLPQGLFEMPSQKVPGLDPRYDAVVAKAIREDRDIRYQSAAELRADLDSILTQPVVKVDPAATQAPAALPTVARPQRPQGYVQRQVQPVPKKSSSTGILLVAALVLVAGGFFVFKDKLLPGAASAPTQPVTAETSKTDPATPAPSAEETVKKDAASTTPVPATAQPASMPVAVPKTEPVTAKPVAPQTDLEKRIATLETGFQNAAKAEPEQVFQQSMAALNKSYLAALDRSLATATQKGELDDAVALREEKQRMEKGSAVPGLLEESTLITPVRETVKKLRDTYRATQLQHATTKAKAIAALCDKYDQALAAIQADLTKGKKLDEALTLKPVRDELSRRKAAVLAMQPAAVAAAEPAAGFTNSLGMKFVPVPDTDILMCIHETRYGDYAAYAAEAQDVASDWMKTEVDSNIPENLRKELPATVVSWEDTKKFCAWLSKRESRLYRLPTDAEWSIAVGLGHLEKRTKDITPEILNNQEKTIFPWEGDYPPRDTHKVGNFADMTWHEKKPDGAWIDGYNDGYVGLAPVMSFKPNKLGIYDLGGNAWEWVEDRWNNVSQERVLRGAAFYLALREHVRASNRVRLPPGMRAGASYGFRVVLKVNSATAATMPPAKPATTTVAVPKSSAQLSAQDKTFANSLGMKFVPVPGTQILLCAHETRRADYAAYAAETPAVDASWKDQKEQGNPVSLEDACPVVAVSWNDAQAFCEWLSKKEGRTYRLPTELEWSHAAGIGPDEERIGPARTGGMNVPNTYPWGNSWPPPAGAGNYADEKVGQGLPGTAIISGYADGYLTTAPVMQFKPNALGIYDLGGNVKEWCADRWSEANTDRIVREGDWAESRREYLLSSARTPAKITTRSSRLGFRCALELPADTAGKPPAAAVPAVSVPAPVMPPAATIAPTVAGTPAVSVNGVPEMVFFETKGQVKVIGPDGKMSDGGVALSRGAEVTTLVVFGSTVKTGAASSADLALSGGGSVRLDADTELKLSGAVNGSNAGETLELVKGRLFLTLDSEDLAQRGVTELRLKTPCATLGIKGGKCYVEIGPKFETIGMFKGIADVAESSLGGKTVLRDDMGVSVKPGALSPPQRLSSSQAPLVKVCDEIELVRMETEMREVDTPADKAFEDTYFYPNTSEETHLTAFATLQRTALPNRRTKGALVIIKPNEVTNARHRTVSFKPQVEVPRAFSKVVAIENSYRGDGIVYLNTTMSVPTKEGLEQIDALPSSVESDRVYCALGNGGMGDWRRNMYPFLADVVVPGIKFIEFGHYVYPGGKGMKIQSVVPGKNEYRLEMGPVVIIARKR